MPRQNFITSESFVDSSIHQVKDSILSIPAFVSNIRLLADNKVIESIRFSYEVPLKEHAYHINVSIQPLDDRYTRISLHASYANGKLLQGSNEISSVLNDFQSAILASLKGDTTIYKPFIPKESYKGNMVKTVLAFATTIGVIILKKKLS